MEKVLSILTNRYLMAVIGGLFLWGVIRKVF